MWRKILLGLLIFDAVSAVAGMSGLVTNGVGMDTAWLVGTPFTSYLWPGILLGVVVGGTHVLATVLVARRTRYAALAAEVAAFALLVWIFVEAMILTEHSWMQWLYFVTAAAEIGVIAAWTGIFRPHPEDGHASTEAAGVSPRRTR